MLWPNILILLAAIRDIRYSRWTSNVFRVYRFWRDIGFVLEAIRMGFIADLLNMFAAIQVVAWNGLVSDVVVVFLMKETKNK